MHEDRSLISEKYAANIVNWTGINDECLERTTCRELRTARWENRDFNSLSHGHGVVQ